MGSLTESNSSQAFLNCCSSTKTQSWHGKPPRMGPPPIGFGSRTRPNSLKSATRSNMVLSSTPRNRYSTFKKPNPHLSQNTVGRRVNVPGWHGYSHQWFIHLYRRPKQHSGPSACGSGQPPGFRIRPRPWDCWRVGGHHPGRVYHRIRKGPPCSILKRPQHQRYPSSLLPQSLRQYSWHGISVLCFTCCGTYVVPRRSVRFSMTIPIS